MKEHHIPPLYERLRPEKLEDFVGQKHLIKSISTILKATFPPNILFFGPPGCGKTTLAQIIGKNFSKNIVHLSGPETGVSEIKKLIQDTDILILDEIHRFSKAQQDVFLPILEKGKLRLFATTTENPSFSITRQLLSRLHVLKLNPLQKDDLKTIAQKGMEELSISLPEDVIDYIINVSMGDARSLLNILEFAKDVDPSDLTVEKIEEVLPKRVIMGNRQGDLHYHLASALIKSIRGSDPDAAVYYLACMLESGEDPRFICRRLIISAAEDIGLADPYALTLAVSCYQAVELIGMPEGFIPMSETTIYLSLAPKSNSSYRAYLEAQGLIKEKSILDVPLHLKNPSTGLDKKFGYGKGYKYPHAYKEAWVKQQYLPDELKDKKFYKPRTHGKEPYLLKWLKTRIKKDF
ncbi:replication-associated recombination protein A [Desulfothermus okinawensis JCM 13304]